MKITYIFSSFVLLLQYRSVAQRAAVIFADFLIMSTVFAHTANPTTVLLDRQTSYDASAKFFLHPDKIRRKKTKDRKLLQVILSSKQCTSKRATKERPEVLQRPLIPAFGAPF